MIGADAPAAAVDAVAFDAWMRARAGREPAWVSRLRREAFARFARRGIPAVRDEAWRFTNPAPLARTAFAPAEPDEAAARAVLETLPVLSPLRLVFVDGAFSPALSHAGRWPEGLVARPMAAALADGEPLAGVWGEAVFPDNPLADWNTASFADGAFLRVSRRAIVRDPVHVVFIATAQRRPAVCHPRFLVILEEAAQATVAVTVATALGASPATGSPALLVNAVGETALGPGAVLEHLLIQREAADAWNVFGHAARQARGSALASHVVSLGDGTVRNDLAVRLEGEGANALLAGLFAVGGRAHVDNHTFVDHAAPRASSLEIYKGILDGRSSGVFNGRIRVRPGAQKTDARQANKNLLLSSGAIVNTNPQLQIDADDVKCAHGAAVGQIDEEALFYLRSRGLPEEAARGLLVYGFAGEVLSRIRAQELRERLDGLVRKRLPGAPREAGAGAA